MHAHDVALNSEPGKLLQAEVTLLLRRIRLVKHELVELEMQIFPS